MSSSDSSDNEPTKPGTSSPPPSTTSSSFLAELENEFKDRYTDKDKSYVAQFNRELAKPPCFHPWNTRNPRQFNHNRNSN